MVRLRLISFGLAGLICGTLIIAALTQRFSAIMEMFDDNQVVKAEIEQEKKPPPPPPPPPPPNEPPPPPPQEIPPPPFEMPAIVTQQEVTTQQAPPELQIITSPSWARRPNGADYERFWPRRARESEIEGAASLDCIVDAEGRLACSVTSETPPNMGFGEAAVRVARQFRMNPQTVNGQATAGGRYRLRIPFRFAGD